MKNQRNTRFFIFGFFLKSIKEHNIVKKPSRVMALDQIVALVMVNKCVKFHKICLDSFEIKANVKVFGRRQHLTTPDNADAGVTTIARIFFFEKQTS